jgi:ComF family protein
MEFIDILLSKLAPHICVGCGQEGSLLCPVCDVSLPSAQSRDPIAGLGAVWAAAEYSGIARDVVWQLKFRGARAAVEVMARHMVPLIPPVGAKSLIVPVPTATRRVRQRGFDQAKLLARQLSRRTGLRYADCLRRHGQTHQVGASRQQRLHQLKNAFHLINGVDLRGHEVILVDDVWTTGATLEAATDVIRTAAPDSIDAIVFAQAD